MCLSQEDCPPLTFGLIANDTAKLLSKSFLFLAAILSTEERVALRLQRNYLLKKSVKNIGILQQMVQLLSTTVAPFTYASRNHVDVKI